MIILFDIDHTLLSTDHFSRYFIPALARQLGVSITQLRAIRSQYYQGLEKSTDFDPRDFMALVVQETGKGKSKKLLDLYYTKHFFSDSLFDDTARNLKLLKQGNKLGIFSEGTPFFQKKKIELSGIKPFFDEKMYFINKRKERPEYIKRLPTQSFIVEDKRSVITELLKREDITPIWLNRKSPAKHKTAATIHSLDSLPRLLENVRQ